MVNWLMVVLRGFKNSTQFIDRFTLVVASCVIRAKPNNMANLADSVNV